MMRRERQILIRALAIASALALAAASCGKKAADPGAGPSPSVQLPSLDVMLADKVMGNASAPVPMIEYSSLTCPHCASFHASTLPLLKAAYVDTGKVRFVYRDFPLDTTAMSAAMVARCSGDRYFQVLDLLFKAQTNWSGGSNPTSAIKSAVAPAGMTGAEVDACLAMTDLRNGITNMKTAGQLQYGISGTPTFIIGSQTVVGAQPYAVFDALLKSLTQ